jgi:uridylate kinase
MPPEPRFRRVVLKISGEALKGDNELIQASTLMSIARQIKEVADLGAQVAVVVGGGNIFRGTSEAAAAMNRTVADHIGMLGTLINSLALQVALEDLGSQTRVMSAIGVAAIAEAYIRRRAIRHLEKGRVIIIACGTGSPYFSTDTAAALRANEIEAEVVLKATNVDGVYDADPRRVPTAKRYGRLSYDEAINQDLRVMDATAFTLCRENRLPIIVFDLRPEGNIRRVVMGEPIGTLVGDGAKLRPPRFPQSSSTSTEGVPPDLPADGEDALANPPAQTGPELEII